MNRHSSIASCQRIFTQTVNASPVILLGVILLWAYWAYSIRLSQHLINDNAYAQAVLYLIFFQPLFVMCVWSFVKAVNTNPGNTLDADSMTEANPPIEACGDEEVMQLLKHRLTTGGDDDEDKDNEHQYHSGPAIFHAEAMESTVSIDRLQTLGPRTDSDLSSVSITVKKNGELRFCQKCKLYKYDRTHHCRVCKRCILRMDHHCPWINNCVGYYNHKFFYLFLIYATLLCLYIFGTTLPELIRVLNRSTNITSVDLNWALMTFFSAIFALFLLPFTIFHTRQILKNRTTIEYYETATFRLGKGQNRKAADMLRSKFFNPWDIGYRANFEQVMGYDPKRWFLPVGRPQGNGRYFTLNKYAYDTLATDE